MPEEKEEKIEKMSLLERAGGVVAKWVAEHPTTSTIVASAAGAAAGFAIAGPIGAASGAAAVLTRAKGIIETCEKIAENYEKRLNAEQREDDEKNVKSHEKENGKANSVDKKPQSQENSNNKKEEKFVDRINQTDNNKIPRSRN